MEVRCTELRLFVLISRCVCLQAAKSDNRLALMHKTAAATKSMKQYVKRSLKDVVLEIRKAFNAVFATRQATRAAYDTSFACSILRSRSHTVLLL